MKGYDFVDSIQSPTFSGISLPSLCYDSSRYSILPMPSSSDVYNSVTVTSGPPIINQKSLSCKPILGATELRLLNKDNFNSRLLVYVINLYVIFEWDPGKFNFLQLQQPHIYLILFFIFYAMTVIIFGKFISNQQIP